MAVQKQNPSPKDGNSVNSLSKEDLKQKTFNFQLNMVIHNDRINFINKTSIFSVKQIDVLLNLHIESV